MNPIQIDALKRRTFLGQSVTGLGLVALNSLLNPAILGAQDNDKKSLGAINPLHFAPKAKRVIYLYQAGGPSHLETFDYKPALAKLDGQAMPESFTKGQQFAQLQGKALKCFAPQFGFKRFGKVRRSKSASCFRKSAASRMSYASCDPCGASRSITIRRTCL